MYKVYAKLCPERKLGLVEDGIVIFFAFLRFESPHQNVSPPDFHVTPPLLRLSAVDGVQAEDNPSRACQLLRALMVKVWAKSVMKPIA